MEKIKKYIQEHITHVLCIAVLLLLVVITAQFIQTSLMRGDFNKDSVLKTRQIQRLDAGLDFQVKRSQFLILARDSILKKHNPDLTDDEAYSIAEFTLYVSEKYKIDPVLFFAVCRQESRFNKKAISSEGAIGLGQILPLTGRILCDALQIPYSEAQLYDVKFNAELTGKYLSYLKTEYNNNTDLILIGYNAGPLWANRYRNGNKDTPTETTDYLLRVKEYYVEFNKLLACYLPGNLIKEG